MRTRLQYVVRFSDGSYVHRFERYKGHIPGQYTATASTDDRDEAVRVSYNVAQAVARRNNCTVEVA